MAMIANTLSMRIAGALLAGLVLFNAVMAIALFAPIGRERAALLVLPLPAQASAIVRLLEASHPQQRPLVLAALNSPALAVRLLDELPREPAGGLPRVRYEQVLGLYDSVFADHEFHLDLRKRGLTPRLLGGEDAADFEPIRLFVRLEDGVYVLIQPARAAMFDTLLVRGLTIGAIAGLAIIIGLILAVRRTARPVAELAGNAHAFADRLDAPDLEERGPAELRDLAAAFNHMKRRIRALVSERTRFLAAIAHDLRTYLTRLRLRADFIADPGQRARAERDLDEMAALLEETLDFARASEASGEPGAQTPLVQEIRAFALARQEMGEAVSVEDEPEGEAVAAIEPIALRRILGNLTDNALRYGQAARIRIALEERYCVISIEDDGPGLPETALDRVTAPFERLESSRARASGGAGLGLAIVAALAQRRGGALVLANKDTGGLIASVRLPHASKSPDPWRGV